MRVGWCGFSLPGDGQGWGVKGFGWQGVWAKGGTMNFGVDGGGKEEEGKGGGASKLTSRLETDG